MSQVREHLNPGLLEGDLLGSKSGVQEEGEQHVRTSEGERYSADNNNISQQQQQRRNRHHSHQRSQSEGDGGNNNEEEENLGGGHDSDPPIENQNPEDGK